MAGFAWVTLATNDSYSLGALVLAHSLRRVGSKHDLAVLVTPGVTGAMREKLASVFSLVQEVNVLDSKDEANLALLARPELGITFTKLHCWRLTQYEKCVFVDADTLVIRNCDELFEREELSAAPDVGWPDCFNSGVFVFKPSQQTFASITAFAAAKGSFDGGDQGLLNQYFSDWAHKDISKHLPFIYNMCSTATYSYLPAFKQFGEDVRIIHFIGITKPWLQYFDTVTGQVQPAPGSNHLQPLLQLWWHIFCENVHPQLSPVMASSTLASVWHESPACPPNSPPARPRDPPDVSYDDIQSIEPDFSEFQDPWENYGRESRVESSFGHSPSGESDFSSGQFDAQNHPSVLDDSRNKMQDNSRTFERGNFADHSRDRHSQQDNQTRNSSSQTTWNHSGENDRRTEDFQRESHRHEQNYQQEQNCKPENYRKENYHQEQSYHNPEYHRKENEHQEQIYHNPEYHHKENEHQEQIYHNPEYHHKENDHQEQIYHNPEYRKENEHQEQIYHNPEYHHNENDHQQQIFHNPEYHHKENDHQEQTYHNPEYHHNENDHQQQTYHNPEHHHNENDHQQQTYHKPENHYEQNHRNHEDVRQEQRHHDNSSEKMRHQQDSRNDENRAVDDSSANSQPFDRSKSCDRVENKRDNRDESHASEENRLQDRSNVDYREKQTDVNGTTEARLKRTTESRSPPAPCSKSQCTATQSEPNIAGQLESNDAGIAGALAKITLGEARSPEQLAFEEHMRKQSWEQGQIDYMGRDSFDNIWKKISETLGVQSQRQPSPPKTLPKPEESEAAVATPVATEDQPAAKKSEAAVPAEPREKEEQDLTRSDAKVAPQTSQIEPSKITTEAAKIPPQSPISSDAAMNPVALAAIVPQVPTATPEKSSADHPAASTPTALDSSIKQVAEILLRDVQDSSEFSSKASEAAAAISPAEDKKSASEKDMKIEQIVSDSPVPIQVAESVLEAEVKESVTEDLRPVTEEAISSISVSAQESVLETVMQAAVAPTASTPNGAAVLDPISEIGNGIDALSLSTPARMEENLPVVQPQATPEAARREETSAVQAARLETPEVETEAQKSEAVLAEVGREAAEVATETQKSDTVLAEICQKAAEVATETQKSDTVLAEIGGKAAEVTTETPQTLVAVEAAAAKPLEREESKVSPVESQEALPKEPETSVLASVKSLEKPEEPKILTEAEKLSSIAAEATKKPQEEAELLVKSESSSSPVEVSVKTEDTKVSAKLEEPAEKIAEIQPSKSEESAACPMKPKTAASTKPEEKSSSLPVAEAKTAEIQPSKSEESAACPIKPKTATPTKPEEKSSSLPVVETKTAEIQPSKSEESAACPIKPKTAPPTKPKEKSSSPPVVEAKTTEIQPSKSEESAACPIKPKTAVSTKPEEKSSLPVADSKTAEESAACPLKPKIATSTKPEETKPAEKPATKPKVPKDESKESETSEDLVSQSESSEESPVRPARTKEQQIIPGTPIVTEATPPTSPPIGAVETFGEQPAQPAKTTKKVVKKVTKKTTTTTSAEKPADGAEGTTTEGETKKVTKKVVKKVAKKTKDEDGAEASGTTEKPKKIVKVVKKTTKVGQTLEADATAPETPPPGATEVPVPPKRKLKTVAKSTPAKTETEP